MTIHQKAQRKPIGAPVRHLGIPTYLFRDAASRGQLGLQGSQREIAATVSFCDEISRFRNAHQVRCDASFLNVFAVGKHCMYDGGLSAVEDCGFRADMLHEDSCPGHFSGRFVSNNHRPA